MQRTFKRTLISLTSAQVVVLILACHVQARSAKASYATMAPLDQYLIANRGAEIALARSAAPKSISDGAEILVLGRHGYETAVKGTNGFVCLVERSWDASPDDPGFWNPKVRGPDCLNAAAARSFLPIVIAKTKLALAGRSSTQIADAIDAAFRQKKLPVLEPAALGYMLSRDGYLSDQVGRWHPHVMFFVQSAEAKAWGAGFQGSPVLASVDAPERLTIIMIPVARWSDGTPDSRT